MDEDVVKALAKWPNVPDCYGWLALDRRGRWRMRDEYAQAHALLGDIVRNATLKSFIDRNYACDERGAWFFQNGPQRVFVDLEGAPFVFFLEGSPLQIKTHHGKQVDSIASVFIDEHGSVWLDTDVGFGLVCDRDLGRMLECITPARGVDTLLERLIESPEAFVLRTPQTPRELNVQSIAESEAPVRFRYLLRPGGAYNRFVSTEGDDLTPHTILRKTELGRATVSEHGTSLTRGERNALVLADGKRSLTDLMKMTGIQDVAVIAHLVGLGMLEEAGEATHAKEASPPSGTASPAEGAASPGAITATSATDGKHAAFQKTYSYLTSLIPDFFGFTAFTLTLKLEKASTLEDLEPVKQKLLETIEKKRGKPAADEYRRQFDELARG